MFATPRALALSYVDAYIDFTGRRQGLRRRRPARAGRYDWRLRRQNVWKVEQMLIDWPHRKIRSSHRRASALRAHVPRVPEAHGYQAVDYERRDADADPRDPQGEWLPFAETAWRRRA